MSDDATPPDDERGRRIPASRPGAVAIGTVAFEDDLAVVFDDTEITFGRAPEVAIRVGHAPLLDNNVPRRAGSIFASRGRIVVANSSDRLAFDVCAPDQAPQSVRPGAWYSPAEPQFEIRVSGVLTYVLSVHRNDKMVPTLIVDRHASNLSGPPTGATVELTERQRRVLRAYVAPLTKGGGPATHSQVAQELHMSRAAVRVECNNIWSAMLLGGIPMRNFKDARDQIADAWARHRI